MKQETEKPVCVLVEGGIKEMKRFLISFLCIILIPVIANANFELIDSVQTDKYIDQYSTAVEWWDQALKDPSSLEIVRLFVCTVVDVQNYDASYDFVFSDNPLAMIGVDKAGNDLHLYLLNMHGTYSHVQLFRTIGKDSRAEMIYEKIDIPYETAKENLSTITDEQYLLTSDTYRHFVEE